MFHFFHRWGKWELYMKGNVTDDGVAIGFYVSQKRTCSICNAIKIRTVKSI